MTSYSAAGADRRGRGLRPRDDVRLPDLKALPKKVRREQMELPCVLMNVKGLLAQTLCPEPDRFISFLGFARTHCGQQQQQCVLELYILY